MTSSDVESFILLSEFHGFGCGGAILFDFTLILAEKTDFEKVAISAYVGR